MTSENFLDSPISMTDKRIIWRGSSRRKTKQFPNDFLDWLVAAQQQVFHCRLPVIGNMSHIWWLANGCTPLN
jgi:hypothetical protein